MKRTAALVPAVALLLLAGCSAGPSRDEVSERFLIEYTDSDELRQAMQEVADEIAQDAIDGRCGDGPYEAGLQTAADDNLFYAWRSTCLMYFEDDLSAAQIAETQKMTAERVAAG